MSRKYLRIYCNGQRARTTGHEKYIRDEIIERLGGYDPSTISDIKDIYKHIPFEIYYRDDIFRFRIEIVKSTKTSKTVIETINPKYHVKKNIQAPSGISIVMETFTIDKDSIFDYNDFSKFIKENFMYEAKYYYNDPLTYRDSCYRTIAVGNDKELLEKYCIEKGFKKSEKLLDGGYEIVETRNFSRRILNE